MHHLPLRLALLACACSFWVVAISIPPDDPRQALKGGLLLFFWVGATVCAFLLSKRLNRSASLWVFLAIITSTLGPIILAFLGPAPRLSAESSLETSPANPSGTPMTLGEAVSRGVAVMTFVNTGIALNEQGRHEQAANCYDQALAADPHCIAAWANKGKALLDMGDQEAALQCHERVIALDPVNPESWSDKGVTLRALGRVQEALACYERALEINPNFDQAWSNKGNLLYADMNQSGAALDCYSRALKLNQENGDAWFNKGAVLGNMRRDQEAYACFQQAERLGHPSARAAMDQCRV